MTKQNAARNPDATHARYIHYLYRKFVSVTDWQHEQEEVASPSTRAHLFVMDRATNGKVNGPMARFIEDGPTYGLKRGPAIRREAAPPLSNSKSTLCSLSNSVSVSGNPSFFFSSGSVTSSSHLIFGTFSSSVPVLGLSQHRSFRCLFFTSDLESVQFLVLSSLLLVNGLRVSSACFSSSSRAKRWIWIF